MTFFKIKTFTKMSKVMGAYAKRMGVQETSLRFLLDGDRVGGEQTAMSLELIDGDQMDAVLEQTGGLYHSMIS